MTDVLDLRASGRIEDRGHASATISGKSFITIIGVVVRLTRVAGGGANASSGSP
jgi:hypothetical protein